MKTRRTRKTKRTAREQAQREISDCAALLERIEKDLQDYDAYSAQRPADWGYAGTAADIRLKLERILISVSVDIDDTGSEEDAAEAARRLAGIDTDRTW